MFACLFKKQIVVATHQPIEVAKQRLDSFLTHKTGNDNSINLKGKFVSEFEFTATIKSSELGGIKEQYGSRNWWLSPNAKCKLVSTGQDADVVVKFNGDDMWLFYFFAFIFGTVCILISITVGGFLPFWLGFMMLIMTLAAFQRINDGRQEVINEILKVIAKS